MVIKPAMAQPIAGIPKSAASVSASRIVPISLARCEPRLTSQAAAIGAMIANAAKTTADHKYPFMVPHFRMRAPPRNKRRANVPEHASPGATYGPRKGG